MATGAVAAAIARARRNIQHHFFSADAVRPDRSITFEPGSLIERRQFERLRSRDIIREGEAGTYWLDVVAYDVDLTARYNRVRIGLLVAIMFLLVGLVMSWRAS